MSRYKKVILFIFLLCLFKFGNTQYYSSGQDPASIKWQQIKTKYFQIIYPEDFEKQSQYLANVLETVYKFGSRSLGYNPKKIPLILHNQSVISNAYVAWAPKRMEFYTCPPQDSYSENWLEQLSIHEFRHVVQIDILNQGFTKVLYYIFGQQATGAILGLFIPRWFMEGDAVCTETALSNSGRGRLPSFEKILRAQLLEKGKYNYEKAVHGSYKNFVPGPYNLGYYFVGFNRIKFGDKIWENALKKSAKYPFIITPFSRGIKNISKLSKVQLYNSTLTELRNLWEKQFNDLTYSNYTLISKINEKNYTNYELPLYLNDSLILTEKSGIDDINRFVTIDKNGNEKRIFTPGFNFHETLSYSKNKIYWAEKTFDPRWENRDYAIIKTYNLKTKKQKQLTKKSRLFAPDVSHNGKNIVAVEVTTENKYYLQIINSETGKKIKKFSTPDNLFFMTPSWSENDKKIVMIVLSEKGKSIAVLNIESEEIKYLTPFSFIEISKPVINKNHIFFTGAYSGIDNIYAFNLKNNQIYQVTSVKFGAYDADISTDGEKMIFSNYTANGFEIVETNINQNEWIPLKNVNDNSIKLYEKLAKKEDVVIDKKIIPDKKYETKKYQKWKHLFNFHSWAPLSIDVNNTEIKPGVSLMSQNKLSTAFTTLGYEYDINEEAGKYYLNFSYQGWYPVIDVSFDYGKRKQFYTDSLEKKNSFSWHETNIKTGISLPLNLSKNKYFRRLQPKINLTQIYLNMDDSSPFHFVQNSALSLDYSLLFYNQIKSSYRDLYPKWGQILKLIFRNTPFQNNNKSSIYAIETYFYLPGFVKHNGFKLYGAYQNKIDGNYKFSDEINYPRGYTQQNNEDLYSFSVNYKFSLYYPDFNIGSILYLKRIKTNLFFDYAIGENNNIYSYYKSTGIELSGDFHLLSFIAPMDFGVRAIYLPDTQSFEYEFLFSVNFDALY